MPRIRQEQDVPATITNARPLIAELTAESHIDFRWVISQKSRKVVDARTSKEQRLYLDKVEVEMKPKLGGKRIGSFTIPIDCQSDSSARLVTLLTRIHERVLEESGQADLKGILKEVSGVKKRVEMDFPALRTDYRKHVLKQVNEEGWKSFYGRAFNRIEELMTLPRSERPADGQELAKRFVEPWDRGRMQDVMKTKARHFINWAIDSKRWPLEYDLPRVWKSEGKAPAKRIGYPISDVDILWLVYALQQKAAKTTHAGHSEQATKWAFAVQIMSVYGLRPEDLAWLRVETDRDGVKTLHSDYPKAQGISGKTDPRQLQPILVRNVKGEAVDWNLLERIESGESFGDFKPKDAANDAANGLIGKNLNRYLNRQAIWKEIKARARKENPKNTVTAYSFRHRYSKEAHARLEHPDQRALISQAMGHSPEVHDLSYNRFQRDSGDDAFAAINQ